MCIQHILISDCPLPEVQNDLEFPDLSIEKIDSFSELAFAVRQIVRAPFLYSFGPSDLCGCYFCYDAAESEGRISGLGDSQSIDVESPRDSEWIWRQGYNSVNSFARYLGRYSNTARLAVYVCWEGDEGRPINLQEVVQPSFFGGSRFLRLPENSLFVITKGDGDQDAAWLKVPTHTLWQPPVKTGHSRCQGKRIRHSNVKNYEG